MEQMHEISFEQIEDGSIRLEQQSGHGERDVILLHPEQLKFITRRMAGMSETTARQVKDLERKLSVIADRLEALVCEKWFREEILDRCGNGAEMINKLDGIVDLAIEMDGGRLLPSESKPEARGNEKKTNATKSTDGQQLGLDV